MTATKAHKTVPKPRRRWFQFSLRTLFVLVTVLCVWLGVVSERARKQREAVAAIEKLGGSVRYEYQYDSSGTFSDTAKPPGPKWLRRLVGDEYFVSVVDVSCGSSELFFFLHHQPTGPGVVHLKGWTKLESLYPNSTPVTDDGLEEVKGWTKLERLALDSPQITDTGLEHLKGFTHLRRLDLRSTQVTDAGLEHLNELTKLQELWLVSPQVTDAGLEHLKGLTNLEFLHLDGYQITDAGLVHLKGLTNLRTLLLVNTQVTDKGVGKLQQALPNCRI